MTRIQQVHWELEMDYIGHPYYVSGNAILHAIAHQLNGDVPEDLRASHGFFVPGEFGRFPEDHPRSGYQPYLGTGLPEVESYEDLFLFREPSHRWLLDSRPRDATNVHDLRIQSGHPALTHETILDLPEHARNRRRTTKLYVTAYLHADSPSVLPLKKDHIDGLQFGGKRNYGYGTVRLKESQLIDLKTLDYSRLEDADAYRLQLVTPFVLESESTTADDRDVPWWWREQRQDLRDREEMIVFRSDVVRLKTIDHGQIVRYGGDQPVETAQNGIRRIGSHSKYGFGEFRVAPVGAQ